MQLYKTSFAFAHKGSHTHRLSSTSMSQTGYVLVFAEEHFRLLDFAEHGERVAQVPTSARLADALHVHDATILLRL